MSKKNMEKSETILLEDETLRDGLQMEKQILSTDEKLYIYRSLVSAGVQRIQVGSFVHPQVVPQMADTDDLIKAIHDECEDDCIVSALVLNEKGLIRAIDCKLHHLTMSVSVSDTHSKKNVGKVADQVRTEMAGLIGDATASGISVRAGIQCAFGCSYEGTVDKTRILDTAILLSESGAEEINLADTAGLANPRIITETIALLRKELPHVPLSLHLHDTYGFGLVNLYSGYLSGVRIFDACIGGLGGCPFVENAVGNVITERAVALFHSLGVETGIDNKKICATVSRLEENLGRRINVNYL